MKVFVVKSFFVMDVCMFVFMNVEDGASIIFVEKFKLVSRVNT